MSEKYNLAVDAGATFSKQFTLLDAFSNPIDLTGVSIKSELREAYADVSASATFNAAIVVPYTSGTFELRLDSGSTAALTGSCYLYDIELTSGSTVTRLLSGKVTVYPNVTR